MMRCIARLALALGVLLSGVAGAWAQTASGNIYGTVADESGAILPGASITLSGSNIAGRTTTSDSSGNFRFLNLDPGSYQMTVGLPGFTKVNRSIAVSTGQNVDLKYTLRVTSVEETITVTGEQPIVDTKKVGTGTTLTKEELSQIPNSRDPWAVLRTIPGVVVDRVNIAGNESGQQSMFQGKGSATTDAMWNLDGVVITDMAAAGASPTYFDYDAFDEINVTTGGNDLKVATGGIGLNFVTKRGTNAFHGAVRGYFTHRDLQTTNIKGTELEHDPRLLGNDKADHIDQVADYGVDVGGPIVKDKLWFWGSYGKQDIRNVRTNQTKDRTLLKDYNGKLNWQMSSNDMFSVFYFLGAKEKFGRGVGFVGNEPDSFLWNQGGYYPDSGPHGLVKAELNHTFSSSFFGNFKYAYYGTGFSLSPRGGLDQEGGVNFATNTAVGSYLFFGTKRPQHVVNVDFNYFTPGMGGNHEFKFGFGYRRTPVSSTSAFGGSKLFALKNSDTGGYAYVTRDRAFKVLNQYSFGYVGDTFTKGRWTINAGVRYDHQIGKNQPSQAAANPALPNILGALDFDGRGTGATWNDLSPRASMSYALDESRKTVLRASFARYAGQLSATDPSFDNPNTTYGYLAYLWNDTNNDGLAQAGELDLDAGVQYSGPGDPSSPQSTNAIDPNYKANHDTEWIVGLDRELAANLALSVAYTHRKANDLPFTPRIGLTTADYTETPFTVVRNGETYTGSQFSPDAAKVAASGNDRILLNRADFSRSYDGVEINLMKRLSNKWMARVGYSYMNWVENYEGPGAIQNPTRTDINLNTVGVGGFAGPSVDGGQVALRSAGSGKGDIFPAPKWQLTASALYELPAGFEVSTSIFGRQGYPRPLVAQRSVPGGEGNLRILVVPTVDTVRYENLWNVDFRLAKNLKLGGSMNAVITADLFNAFNANTELNRVRNVGSSTFGRLDELLSPRVVRFGMRLQF